MAFSFANVAAGLGGDATALKVQDGSELQEIQTDQLGFSAVNGEAKVRLLSNSWPADDLPAPSASLLAVASSLGLVAAAGLDELVVTTTENVRKALKEKATDNVRDIKIVLKKSHSRLAHIAFNADESVLVVSEQSGGLIVYRSDQLKQGQAEPALSISTNNSGLRAIAPNPSVQWAQYIAFVTVDGELMLADLSTGQLVDGVDGPVLARNVSCISWSNKGKQLLAGLGDGTALQMKQDGSIQARIPKSTSVVGESHLSMICWLETHSFFFVYTPNTTSLDEGIPPSEYYIVTRSGTQFTFQKLPEVLPPFGMERVPTHHFSVRLKEWKPHLNDLLVLAATTSSDIGMLSKADAPLSKVDAITDSFAFTTIDDDTRRATLPLSNNADTSPIGMAIDLSATTGIVNPIPSDPEIEESQDPVPNLLVLNQEGILCSWWIVYNDSIRQKTAFSGFSTLSTMEQARSAVSPPNQVSSEQAQSSAELSKETQKLVSESKPAFAQASMLTSPFAKSTTAFAISQSPSGFGTGSGFGSTSAIGDNKSSWASTGFTNTRDPAAGSAFGAPAFGKAGFGTSSASGGNVAAPAFGAPGALSNRPAAFGQVSFNSTPASGNPFGAANSSTTSPFASAAGASGASGFASFADKGGFSGIGFDKNEGSETSAFGRSQQGGSIFGQKALSSSPFGNTSGASVLGKPLNHSAFTNSSSFGFSGSTSASNTLGGSSFKLNSSFKGDGSAKDDLPKPPGGAGFSFGSGFGTLLSDNKSDVRLSSTHDKEDDVDEAGSGDAASESESEQNKQSAIDQSSTEARQITEPPKNLVTPPSTLSQPKNTPAPPLTSLFGTGTQSIKTPESFGGTGFTFGKIPSTTPKDTPAPSSNLFEKTTSQSSTAQVQKIEPSQVSSFSVQPQPSRVTPRGSISEGNNAPKIVTESPSDDDTVNIKKVPEAPLPPDPLSRPGFQTGDTSVSSINSSKPDDAPLPPDFLPANKSAVTKAEETKLPQDNQDEEDGDDSDFSSHFEDSGEDITQDVSPVDDGEEEDDADGATEQVQTSPESSFRGENTTTSISSPTGGLFTKVSANQQTKALRPLFGEIGSSGPIFPPPKPQESPRSPSPVRQLLPHDTLNAESRSVSAPVRPRSAIDQRKLDYTQSTIAAKAAQARDEEVARERARLESLKIAQEQAKNKELQILEDNEDERIQGELAQPVRPTDKLDHFITYESTTPTAPTKADIPAQIERLYQDINSMVYTLGINARSLSSFLAYQQGQKDNEAWPEVLLSETPLDTLNDEWLFQDIDRLHEGYAVLEQGLEDSSVEAVVRKLDQCQELLTSEVLDLKTKVTALRKSIHARMHGNVAVAPLSAEQVSIQHDLRRAATGVQTRLVSVEDSLTVLRARLSDISSTSHSNGQSTSSVALKKPTVEAVTNTVTKMTGMAEKRSADLDVLETQLRRLGLVGKGTPTPSTPPPRGRDSRPDTPGSATSSIYHTPGSNVGASVLSTRSSARKSRVTNVVSVEDKERWQAKSKRKQEVAASLRAVLANRSS